MVNVRKIAYYIISRVVYQNAYSQILINSEIKKNNLDNRDASFLSTLVYGVIERKITLDYIISKYSKVPFSKIEKEAKIIIYIGLYQLLYLDKVPDNSAVDESVKLTKKLKLFRLSGFVNAILRKFIRDKKEIGIDKIDNNIKRLSVKYSISTDIVELLLNQYGENLTEKILLSFFDKPKLTIRINTLLVSKEELKKIFDEEKVTYEDNSLLENSLNISNTGSIENLQSFKDGLFIVQDTASQICVEILNPQENETICDICSAPGGKSITSAIKMGNKGKIYSFDLYENKLNLINENANRLKINIINAVKRDATDKNSDLPICDKILLDVPCSSIGVIRRKPEIRYKKVTNIDLLPKLQYDILCINGDKAPIDSILVYSTCSINKEENENIIEKFLDEHKNFKPVSINLPNTLSRAIDEPEHMLTLLPCNGTDGFFISLLKKVSYD